MFYGTKRICTFDENLRRQNCAQCRFANLRFLHLEKYLRCRFAHFVHDTFLHICRFVHLCFVHVQKVLHKWKHFSNMCAFVNSLLHLSAHLWNCVFHICACFFSFWRFWRKWRKSRNFRKCPENVRKKLTCSWVVHEWFLGNAFDNTGWQKSPEYALIRIAAGAPDLAKSGQIRPRTAPDGKSSRIWRRFRFCSTGWNPVRSCFFRTRAQISDPSTCSRGASSSATESDTFCKCAHTSQNTRWKPPSGLRTFCTHVHTVHNRNRTVHTCAQPRHIRELFPSGAVRGGFGRIWPNLAPRRLF